jgi:hypothetical protein
MAGRMKQGVDLEQMAGEAAKLARNNFSLTNPAR